MKWIISIAVLLSAIPVFCQEEDNKGKSEIERLMETPGSVYTKEFIYLGQLDHRKGRRIGSMSVDILKITSLQDNMESTYGLRFEYDFNEGSFFRTFRGFVDIGELDGILAMYELLDKELRLTEPEHYTEVIYRTQSGMTMGAYFANSEDGWILFIRLREYVSDSSIHLDYEQITQITSYIRLALANWKSSQ
jgi:hypothetical protein